MIPDDGLEEARRPRRSEYQFFLSDYALRQSLAFRDENGLSKEKTEEERRKMEAKERRKEEGGGGVEACGRSDSAYGG